MVEHDHRGVNSRIELMPGFKVFVRAAMTIAGVELLHRVGEGRFNLRRLRPQKPSLPCDLESDAFVLTDPTYSRRGPADDGPAG